MSHTTGVKGLLHHYWRQLAAAGIFAVALLVIFFSVGAPNGSGPALAAPTEDLSTPGAVSVDETAEPGTDVLAPEIDPVFTPSPLNGEEFEDKFIENPVNPGGNDNNGSEDTDTDGEVAGPQDPDTDGDGDGDGDGGTDGNNGGGDGDGGTDGNNGGGNGGGDTDGNGGNNGGSNGPVGQTVDTVEDVVDSVVPGTGDVVNTVDETLDPVTDPVDEIVTGVVGNLPGAGGGNNGGGNVVENVVTNVTAPVLPGVKGLGKSEVVEIPEEDAVELPTLFSALFLVNVF